MADDETRYKRSQQRKRNYLAKIVKQQKQFQPKVVDPRKGRYKRVKFDVNNIEDEEGYFDEYKTTREDT